ncbi:MAG: hypothetical protein ILM98_04750 [Kiritimatiellae bacterium]|nr:hypothetical protein [Kiritimatiellia bacterium]
MNTSKLIPSAFAAIAVATSAALPLAATATTTIVHDAARDLCLNQANAATYTNAYGGVWTFMRADSYNGARTVLTSGRQRTGTHSGQEVVVQRGPAHTYNNSAVNPWFSVNPTAWDDENEIFRGNGFPVIPPGGLSCHPGRTDGGNGSDTKCAVLRFTVPRNGTYRVVAKAWDQNTGKRNVALLVNGNVQAGSPQAWPGNASSPITKDFSLEAATYSAGDTIEFAIDGNGTYSANATGLEFKIEETVEDAVDAAASFRAGQSAASPTNPFTDSFGSWSAIETDGLVTSYTRAAMLVASAVVSEQGTSISGWGENATSSPYLRVNMADAMVVTTNDTGTTMTTQGSAFAPREFMVHPKNGANAAAVLRVIPTAGGIYDIGISARDMNNTKTEFTADDGVNVWLLNGGRALGKMRVSAERTSASGTIFVPEVRVAPGIPVEVVVDNCGKNGNDLTGLVVAFVKRDIQGTSWSANSAMIASESGSPSNPFSQNGATWTAGYCNGGVNGPFTAYRTRYDVGTAITGWKLGTAANIPRIAANTAGRILTSTENGAQLPLGEGALMGHPNNANGATAVRFTAPRDGVYSASAWATDYSYANTSATEDNGVAVHILAGGKSLDSITIKSSASVTGQGVIGKDSIYLKSGQTIDFVIDRNGHENSDATELYAWVDEEASLTAQSVLSVDFDCGASGTYAGPARVGYSDALWNRMNLQNGAASAKSRPLSISSSERTAATLTISKVGGISATADGGAMDTTASALFRDGVASTGTSDVTFTLTGLLPEADYELYLYSRAKSGDAVVNGAFASGGAEAVSTEEWFADNGGDYAVLKVRSDASGVATGTFSSASDATAVWGGVQIVGPGFEEFVPDATTVIFR